MGLLLDQLTERLNTKFGDRLVSLLLYGSAAIDGCADGFSDYNVLCVMQELTPRELADVEPIYRWWREKGQSAPVLLSELEVRHATDCFAMEFADMKIQHRVLAGRNVVENLEIDRKFYRARVEYEVRSKILRLRQRASSVLSDKASLLALMADSLSTFSVVMRHALVLDGKPPLFDKAELTRAAAREFRLEEAPFLQLIEFRQNRLKAKDIDAPALFATYLQQLHLLAETIDRIPE